MCLIFKVGIALLIAAPGLATEPAGGRYALLIGANRGDPGDTPLRYATHDADQMADVLRTIGGFLPEDMTTLQEPSADRVRAALARLNARIRTEQGAGRSFLFVFYSGHADALSLHLGGTKLPWDEMRNLVAGSAASTRLVVADACRSGQATRVKGTKLAQPFALPASNVAMPEGFAILSSATAGESAQESDEIRASFFTHHLVSALRGVADKNNDGAVSLAEAYQYTAERTVASTATTLAGLQHPTYLYDLRGRSDLIITRPSHTQGLALARLSKPGQYLMWEGAPNGPLALEAVVGKSPRAVKLRPGRYFVRHRVPKRFFEGTVELRAEQPVDLGRVELRAVEYAELVRKGGSSRSAYSLGLWGGMGTTLVAGFSPPWLAGLGFSVDMAQLTLDLQAAFSQGSLDSADLPSQLRAVTLAGGARKVFDFRWLALSAGLRLGASLYDQQYDGDRIASARRRLVPHLDTVLRADVDLPQAMYAGLEGNLRVSYLIEQGSAAELPVQGFVLVGVGRYW